MALVGAQENDGGRQIAPVVGAREAERPAEDLAAEIEAHLKTARRSLPMDEFVQTHRQIAALVDELRRTYPEDHRVAKYLTERWLSLQMIDGLDRSVDRKKDLFAEIRDVLQTTEDPILIRNACFFESMLRLREPIDGPAAASLAEKFARDWPTDDRGGELLYEATQRLDAAWWVRMTFVTAFSVIGGLLAASSMCQRRRLVKRLGLLSVLTLVAVAIYFKLAPEMSHVSRMTAIAAMVIQQVRGVVGSSRAATVVALAGSAALIVVVLRNWRANVPRASRAMVQQWGICFMSALVLCTFVDASLVWHRSSRLTNRIVQEYSGSYRGRIVQGQNKQREQLGKSFELEFTDVISGRPVSTKNFRGKIVVVNFWATWCGPCVREIPEMKQLYARYHDQGVEFIGVSHDLEEQDGGLEALKAFVAREQLPWPQYYLGGRDERAILTGSASNDFSESWGIEGIPAVFLIDAEGNLFSCEARGKLDLLIPRLLATPKT